MFKNRTVVIAAPLLVAWALATAPASAADSGNATAKPPPKGADLFPDAVVARGKGVEVKRSQVDEEAIHFKAQLAANNQPLPPEQAALLQQKILDNLIQIQLLKSKATDADKIEARKQADKQIQDAKTQLGSDESLNLKLKAQGLTREGLLSKWTDGEVAKIVLTRELKVNISDADIKKFYDDNPSKFEEPEMVRASHILLGTMEADGKTEVPADKKAAKRKLAEDLLKRARAGEDFAKLAREYSDDPGSKDRGGEYKFPRGQMVREFETAAFALKPNEISDIVTTQFGYHIIKLSEKIPAKKRELAEVSTRIKDYLASQAIQEKAPAYFELAKKEAGVEILDDDLKPKETSGPSTTATSARKQEAAPSQLPPDSSKKPESK
jgi:peptidyl-prolyl cis-trans isomerase C